MKRLTNEELAQIRERADKVAGGRLCVILREGKPIEIVNEHSEWIADVGVTEDADFILASYEDIPKLLAEIESLRDAVEFYAEDNGKYERQLDGMTSQSDARYEEIRKLRRESQQAYAKYKKEIERLSDELYEVELAYEMELAGDDW